jgi:hypothetical protein
VVLFVVPIHDARERTYGAQAQPSLYEQSPNFSSPLCFVAFRYVLFRDGCRWVSWCSNPGCRVKDELVRIRYFLDYSTLYIGEDGSLEPLHPLCPCANAGMEAASADVDQFAGDYLSEDIGTLSLSE